MNNSQFVTPVFFQLNIYRGIINQLLYSYIKTEYDVTVSQLYLYVKISVS